MQMPMIFLFLVSACFAAIDRVPFVGNRSCIQNCSWTAYDRNSYLQEYGCRFHLPISDMNSMDCPLPASISRTSSNPDVLPEPIQNSEIEYSFYVRENQDNSRNELCLNVSVAIDPYSAGRLKGIQFYMFSVKGTSFCQNFIFDTTLDYCAAYDGDDCANDPKRRFYYDCFCDLEADQRYFITIRVLPYDLLDEDNRNDQGITLNTPDCKSLDFRTPGCFVPGKKRWAPSFFSFEQLCPPYSEINATFDVPSPALSMTTFYLFVYDYLAFNNTVPRMVRLSQGEYDLKTLDSWEYVNNGRTYRMTSVILDGLPPGGQFFYAIKFKCCDLKYFEREVTKTKEEPPCNVNLTGSYSYCERNCLSCTCSCVEDFLQVGNKCKSVWHPQLTGYQGFPDHCTITVSFSLAPKDYQVKNYSIALFNTSDISGGPLHEVKVTAGSVDEINFTFKNLSVNHSYVPAVKISEVECPACVYNLTNMRSIYLYTPWFPDVELSQDYNSYDAINVTFDPAPPCYGIVKYCAALLELPSMEAIIDQEVTYVKSPSSRNSVSLRFRGVPTGNNYTIAICIKPDCKQCPYKHYPINQIYLVDDPCEGPKCPSNAYCVSNSSQYECICHPGYFHAHGICVGWIFMFVAFTCFTILTGVLVLFLWERCISWRSGGSSPCCTTCFKKVLLKDYRSSLLEVEDVSELVPRGGRHLNTSPSIVVISGHNELFSTFCQELCNYLRCKNPDATITCRETAEGEDIKEKCNWLQERLYRNEKILFVAEQVPCLHRDVKKEENLLDYWLQICSLWPEQREQTVGLIYFKTLSGAPGGYTRNFKLLNEIKNLESYLHEEQNEANFGSRELRLGMENVNIHFERLEELCADIDHWLTDLHNKYQILKRGLCLSESDSGLGSHDPGHLMNADSDEDCSVFSMMTLSNKSMKSQFPL